ncbi:hypothetical protein Tco_0140302 [Tanacetum coccineum]
MSAKDSIATQTCELSKDDFNDFLTLYPIPSAYHVILPKSNQTIFDAPFGYVGLYTHSFSLSNLRLPLTEFFCEVLEYFQRLGRYPTSVRVFPDPILFLASLKFSWEHGQQRPAILVDDEDLAFLHKEPSSDFGIGSPSVSVNTEPLKANEEPEIQPVECKTRGGSSRPLVKRKLAPGSSTSRATRAKTSSSKDDAPFLTISDDDDGLPDVLELKDATAYHLKIFDITPPAWKNHMDIHMDLELLDLHNRCYARQAVVDNVINMRSRELLHVIEKLREPDVVALREKMSAFFTEVKEHKLNLDRMALESQKWAGYQQSLSTLESKVTSIEAEKARLEAIEVALRKEVKELKQDRKEVVSNVLPYATMAFEQVDDMKEPFDLSKVKGYRSSYKKDHTQASNDLATATFPWPAPSRTQVPLPSSQRATPSSIPVSNMMSPSVDASIVKP